MKFGRCDYQGQVSLSEGCPPDIERKLQIRPFPASPPANYADQSQFEGYKYCPVVDHLCISAFSYEGRTDERERPVLSATVALLTPEEFASIEQDIVLLRDYLRSTSRPSESDFNLYRSNAETLDSRKGLRHIATPFDAGFLGEALAHIMTSDRTRVIHDDPARADAFVRLLYSVLPRTLLRTIEFSSVSASPTDPSSEAFLLIGPVGESPRAPAATDAIPAGASIDLRSRTVPTTELADLGRAVFTELLDKGDWYDIAWPEKRTLLRQYLDLQYTDEAGAFVDLTPKLEQMEETIERIHALERAAESGSSLPNSLYDRLFR